MPKRGEPATPAQRAALERGQAARKKKLSVPKKDGETQRERWSRLLDGTLTVRELTDEEIKRCRVHGRGGAFSGPAPRLPSHLAQAFTQEAIRRAKGKIVQSMPEVTKTLLEIAHDPEVKVSDRVKVLMYLADRGLGKAPETIRVEADSDFDRLLREVDLARDMVGEPGGPSGEDGTAP